MIKVENLVKTFGAKRAVDDVSFSVERGEVLGFLGPNGAGKSTTMRIITGFYPPTSGRVTVGGFDIVEDPHILKGKGSAPFDDEGVLTHKRKVVKNGVVQTYYALDIQMDEAAHYLGVDPAELKLRNAVREGSASSRACSSGSSDTQAMLSVIAVGERAVVIASTTASRPGWGAKCQKPSLFKWKYG